MSVINIPVFSASKLYLRQPKVKLTPVRLEGYHKMEHMDDQPSKSELGLDIKDEASIDPASSQTQAQSQQEAVEFTRQLEEQIVTKHLPGEKPQEYLNQDLEASKNAPTPIPTEESQPQSFNRPPSPEETSQFEQALSSGKLGEFEVEGETNRNGKRALILKDPGTGETTLFILGQTAEIQALGSWRNPATPERVSLLTRRLWIEGELRRYETLTNIPEQIESDALRTIDAVVTNPAEREQLRLLITSRIRLHNLAYNAAFGLKEYVGTYQKLIEGTNARERIKFLYETAGVQQAIQLMEQGSGAYFRTSDDLRTGTLNYTTAKNTITTSLVAGGLTTEQASVAIEVAEKLAHALGASAKYDTLVTRTGIVNLNPDHQASEAWVVANWDNIDWANSLNGQGSYSMKRYFNYAGWIQKAERKKGQAANLRRYACSGWFSAVDAAATAPGGPPATLEGLLDRISNAPGANSEAIGNGQAGALFGWALRLPGYENIDQWNGKEAKSILNNPLITPNVVNNDNVGETIPKALANFAEAKAAFIHLTEDEISHEMSRLLEGILNYVGSPASFRDGFAWQEWNDLKRDAAIDWSYNNDLISAAESARLKQLFRISRGRVALRAGAAEIGGGISDAIKTWFTILTRRG